MSDNITDYATKQKKALQGAYSTQDTTDGATTGDTSTYDDLRNQNFASYLDAQISLESAKQNALKNTGNALRASGMGNGGYAAISNNGIANSYLTALGNAQTAYQTQNNSINEQEQAANDQTATNNSTAFLNQVNSAQTSEQLGNVLTTYGYGTLNDDGSISWNDKALKDAGFDSDTIKSIESNTMLVGNNISTNEWSSNHGAGYTNADTAAANITLHDGTLASKPDYGIGDELNVMFNLKNVEEGTVCKLENGRYNANYAYMVYHNGKWYQAGTSDYANAKYHAYIKGGSIKSNQSNIGTGLSIK